MCGRRMICRRGCRVMMSRLVWTWRWLWVRVKGDEAGDTTVILLVYCDRLKFRTPVTPLDVQPALELRALCQLQAR